MGSLFLFVLIVAIQTFTSHNTLQQVSQTYYRYSFLDKPLFLTPCPLHLEGAENGNSKRYTNFFKEG